METDSLYESLDRYGDVWPDHETVCPGECEGTGYVPVHESDLTNQALCERFMEAHKHDFWTRLKLAFVFGDPKELFKKCDGWHFVKCPECEGTGKKP